MFVTMYFPIFLTVKFYILLERKVFVLYCTMLISLFHYRSLHWRQSEIQLVITSHTLIVDNLPSVHLNKIFTPLFEVQLSQKHRVLDSHLRTAWST